MKKILQKAIPKLYGFYFSALHLFSSRKAAETSLRVFCVPRKGKIAPYQKEFLETARHQFMAYENGLIKLYHWKGKGATMLLLHGWESNAWRWKYLIEPMQAQGYNVIAIDAPAHGDSTGEIITAVLYSEVIATVMKLYEPEVVIAHSMGAMAAAYQQSIHQHSFLEKFIMLGSPDTLEVILRGYQDLTGFSDGAYRGLENHIEEKFGKPVEEFATSKFVQNIEVPTLIVHSREDKIVGYECMDSIARRMPDATTYTSSTGGHSLHTPEVVDEILSFLEKY